MKAGWQPPKPSASSPTASATKQAPKNPNASPLGPRFLDWQLQKDPAQSWQECEAHATQLEAVRAYARTLAGAPANEAPNDNTKSTTIVAEEPATYAPKSGNKRKSDMDQLDLF